MLRNILVKWKKNFFLKAVWVHFGSHVILLWDMSLSFPRERKLEKILLNSKWVHMKFTRDQNGYLMVYTEQSIEKPGNLIKWNNKDTIWKVECSDFSERGHCIAWERFRCKLHMESRTQREELITLTISFCKFYGYEDNFFKS